MKAYYTLLVCWDHGDKWEVVYGSFDRAAVMEDSRGLGREAAGTMVIKTASKKAVAGEVARLNKEKAGT